MTPKLCTNLYVFYRADIDIINEERSLKTPSELIKYEIKNILEEENFNNGRIEKIAQLFVENLDDNKVLTNILQDLPVPILKILIQKQLSIMLPVIEAYDKAVSGDLPFSYCDTVARFYEKIFKYTDDYEIKSLIIHRLPKLAYHHNRWYVRTVFSNIFCKIDDASLMLELKEVLTNNLRMTYWCSKSFDNSCLPLEIKRIVRESKEQRRTN